MNTRTAALASMLALAAAGAIAQERAARPGPITVTYRSQTSIYVSGGRASGLAVGDRLAVMSGDERVGELEVVFLAEHSSSARVVSETRPIKLGDRVVRLGAPRPVPSPSQPEITVVPSEAPPATAGSTPAPARAAYDRFARLSGSASAGYSTFRDESASGRDIDERLVRLDVAARELGGTDVDARLRLSGRRIQRNGVRGETVPAEETRQRLYEASVAWRPPEGRFAAMAGRLGAHPFVSLGYLDGVVAEARPLSSVQVGGFAGRSPDALDAGAPSGAKYGGFLRLGLPRGGAPADFVVSGAREFAGSEISREYVGQQAQVRTGAWWLYESVEVDLNRGWRRERTDAGVQLSEARVLASWRASASHDVSVSYERRRSYWTAFTRAVPGELFDLRPQQALRADVSVSRPGGGGFWMGGSVRAIDGEDRLAYAAHGGLRAPRLFSLSLSADGSYYRTLSTQGALATLRAGRPLRGGHRLEGSYTAHRYEIGAGGGWRMSHWLRLSGYGQLRGGLFGRGDVEYALQDERPGLRLLAEAGYRF